MNPEDLRLLGLQNGASLADIKSAFRRLARQMHPDVSANPDNDEVFKRVILAYEALMTSPVASVSHHVNDPPAPPTANVQVSSDWPTLRRQCLQVVTDLRQRSAAETSDGEQLLGAVYSVAADVLEQTIREFDASLEKRARWGNNQTQPLLLTNATSFLEESQRHWESPSPYSSANLTKGALGAVGLTRSASIAGRGASPVDRELAARAVMSSLTEALLRAGIVGSTRALSSRHSIPAAPILMELNSLVSVSQLERVSE